MPNDEWLSTMPDGGSLKIWQCLTCVKYNIPQPKTQTHGHDLNDSWFIYIYAFHHLSFWPGHLEEVIGVVAYRRQVVQVAVLQAVVLQEGDGGAVSVRCVSALWIQCPSVKKWSASGGCTTIYPTHWRNEWSTCVSGMSWRVGDWPFNQGSIGNIMWYLDMSWKWSSSLCKSLCE